VTGVQTCALPISLLFRGLGIGRREIAVDDRREAKRPVDRVEHVRILDGLRPGRAGRVTARAARDARTAGRVFEGDLALDYLDRRAVLVDPHDEFRAFDAGVHEWSLDRQ